MSADDVVLHPGDRVLISTANGQVTLDDQHRDTSPKAFLHRIGDGALASRYVANALFYEGTNYARNKSQS